MANLQKNHGGFSLLELIITVSVMVILTGILLPAAAKLRRSAAESCYMIEARHAYEAAELYMLDRNETADPMDLVYEITRYGLDERKNVLRPYLNGRITKGSYIRSMMLNRYTGALLEIEYCAGGYVINVERNGETEIVSRPGSG